MKHELFEVGLYDYSDLDRRLNKPVKWTSDDLRQIAENYRGGIPLTSEHDKVYIGIGNNIVFEEDKGKLFIDLPDELDMKGKGLSPKVDVLLKDNGDSFGIDTMNLIDVGVTKNPRKITLLNSEITGETGEAGETANPKPPEVENQDANVATNLLLEKLKGKDAEIGKLQDEITTLKKESKKYDKIKKSIEENKEFINNKEDILKELSELRKHENERKIKEYEAKYNFNYNENAQEWSLWRSWPREE